MYLQIRAHHEGEEFDFSVKSDHETGAITFTVDGDPIEVTPNGLYEIGFVMRRVGSFCKQYATAEFMQEFESEWFTGHKKKIEE